MNLSHIPSLTRLSLADCSAITNNSMQVLSRLTNLQELGFVRCRRITEKGLELVELLPNLRSLTVFGCSKASLSLQIRKLAGILRLASDRPSSFQCTVLVGKVRLMNAS